MIQTTTEDTTKIDALNDLGWKLKYSKPDTSIILSEEALKMAKEIGDKKRIADSYNNLGAYQYLKSNYSKALEYYFKSLEIDKEMENKRGMASSYNNIGLIYKDQSNYPKALEYYFKSLEIDKQMDNKRGMANCYNNIG
ncbi:MAG: tetratricopeptide repeat protein, partial [Flavobacteriales bacterium]